MSYQLEYDDITPTAEQDAILNAFAAGQHLAVTALAGTGKTSTLRMCGEAVRRKRGIYLAYNKAIADEATNSFPGRVTCRTAHSYAFRGLGYQYKQRLNGKRMPPWDVARVLGIPDISLTTKVITRTRAASLVREMVGKFCFTSEEEITRFHVPFVRGLEQQVDPVTEVVTPDEHANLGEQLLPYAEMYWDDLRGVDGMFRFEHDHYLKLWALTHPKLDSDFILVDEAQDLNGVLVGLIDDQDEMQKVIVGDANQQIYGWRGSLNAMEVFPVDVTLPLTQSWRFGPEIAVAANVFLEQIGTELRISGNPDKVSAIARTSDPDAVLCRTNGGGLEMVMQQLLRGRKVAFAGGRPKELTRFFEAVDMMKKGQITSHPDLQAFATWQQVVDYTMGSNDPDFKMQVMLVQKYGIDRLLQALRALVVPERADIVISTAHSAKGLEWNDVQLGNDFSPFFEEKERIISEEETRLRYVAVTRAMDTLDPGPLTKEVPMTEVPDA